MEAATGGQATREGLALDARTLTEAFQRTAAAHADGSALRTPGGETQVTWAQYGERVRALAAGLAAFGVGAGDTVAIMLTNRPETVLVDSAAMHIGAIPFSIYNTSSPEQVEYLFSHARCSLVVTESQFASTVLDVAARVDSIEHVFLVDGEVSGALALSDLEAAGAQDFDFEAAWRTVGPQDIATLIYTSGTTGPPKAVELTHENLLWEIRLLDRVFPMRAGGRTISYLPMAHLADRCAAHYQAIVSGASVTFVGDVSQVIGALIDVRPTSWGAVPRVWEKLKAALEAGFASEADGERRAALAGALAQSIGVVRAQQAGEEVPAEVLREREEADAEFFAPLRAMLGLDEVDYLISGAAPIAAEVLEFFSALGLPICEIWGMTETSLIATSNPQDAIRIGTVGPALPGIELSLAEDGELLVRGPTIMRGYRGDPELTAQTIGPGGWRHRRDRRGRLRADCGPQEGAHHQRGGQEHVAGEHREPHQGCVPARRQRCRDRRQAPLQHRAGGTRSRGRGSVCGSARPERILAGRARPGRGDQGRDTGWHRARQPGAEPCRADQAPHDPAGGVAAGRRRAHAHDEAPPPPDHREVRPRDTGDVQVLSRPSAQT